MMHGTMSLKCNSRSFSIIEWRSYVPCFLHVSHTCFGRCGFGCGVQNMKGISQRPDVYILCVLASIRGFVPCLHPSKFLCVLYKLLFLFRSVKGRFTWGWIYFSSLSWLLFKGKSVALHLRTTPTSPTAWGTNAVSVVTIAQSVRSLTLILLPFERLNDVARISQYSLEPS